MTRGCTTWQVSGATCRHNNGCRPHRRHAPKVHFLKSRHACKPRQRQFFPPCRIYRSVHLCVPPNLRPACSNALRLTATNSQDLPVKTRAVIPLVSPNLTRPGPRHRRQHGAKRMSSQLERRRFLKTPSKVRTKCPRSPPRQLTGEKLITGSDYPRYRARAGF